jgi:type I restriction enzyme S subunit
LIRVGDIYSGRISVDNLKAIAPDIALAYSRTDLRGGEVLLTIVGTIGRAAVVPPSLAGANVARAVAVLPLNEQVLPEFVSIVLNARSSRVALTRAAHEVARKTLNLEDVRKFMLPIPSIPVQRTIVGEVERRNSILDAVTRSAETAITRSQRLRDAVLRAAFCGQFGMSRS